MFKDEFRAEWRRLNPRFMKAGDGLREAFIHGFQEGFPGYFAPVRMAWWLVKRGLRATGILFSKGGKHD